MDARPASGTSTVTAGRETPAPVTARPAGEVRTTPTLTKYLGDLHALESHILQALDKQVRLLPDHPDVRARLRVYRNTLEEHLDALEARLQDLGGSPTHPVKEAVSAVLGVAAGLYDKARSEQASKDLRDDYTALNHALIVTAMLHTTALALGDQPTAALCARHLRDHARFVMEINQAMPALVVAELRQDRLPVTEDALEAARRTMHEIWQQPPHAT
jgi:ferritin-like metal-binding protein YciE